MKKTKQEKAVDKLARVVLDAVDKEAGDIIKSYVDVSATLAFKFLSDKLQTTRENYEKDFKKFCKRHRFRQYKIRYIEHGDIQHLDLEIFREYVDLLNARMLVEEWVKLFPNIARKYKVI